jgi:hypothetical protein
MGSQIKLAPQRQFWIAHFTFVRDGSLEGVRQLEGGERNEFLDPLSEVIIPPEGVPPSEA